MRSTSWLVADLALIALFAVGSLLAIATGAWVFLPAALLLHFVGFVAGVGVPAASAPVTDAGQIETVREMGEVSEQRDDERVPVV